MVSLEFLEEKEKKPHLPTCMHRAARASVWKQQQAASASWLLEKWAAQGQTGWERPGQGGGNILPPLPAPQGSLFHFVAKIR